MGFIRTLANITDLIRAIHWSYGMEFVIEHSFKYKKEKYEKIYTFNWGFNTPNLLRNLCSGAGKNA